MSNVYILFYKDNVIGVYELKTDALKNCMADIKRLFPDNLEAQRREAYAFFDGVSSLYRIEKVPFTSK